MINALLQRLKKENERSSLDQSFRTIYDILSTKKIHPAVPKPSSLYQVMNLTLTDGESFTVPIEIKNDGSLSLAAMVEGDGEISIKHGDHDLTPLGVTKGDGIMTCIFRSESDELHSGDLTITYTGNGEFGPAAFYFSEEVSDIVAVGNYMGGVSEGNDTEVLTLEEANGGSLVHVAAWNASAKGSPETGFPRPNPIHQNQTWGEAISGTPIVFADDNPQQCGDIATYLGDNTWEFEPNDKCFYRMSILTSKIRSIGAMVEIDFEVDHEDNVAHIIFQHRYGSESGWDYPHSGLYSIQDSIRPTMPSSEYIYIRLRAKSMVGKTRIKLHNLVSNPKSFVYAFGKSVVPAFESQTISYYSGITGPNVVSGIELRHAGDSTP